MEELRRIYRQALSGRIDALEAARVSATDAGIATIRRVAHSLRGSGGTYGFPEISAAAAEVELAGVDELSERLDALLRLMREAATPAAARQRILIVDDDPELQLLLRAILAGETRELVIAEGYADGVEKAAAGSWDLVILDLLLPDGDGRSLLLKIRERAATSNVPIIVLSATDSPQTKAECFSLGADIYFEKPFDPDTLAAAAAERLRRSGRERAETAGTTFDGTAARDEAPLQRAAQRSGARESDDSEPARILLVEDDELVSSILRHRLMREGFEVTHVADGESALDLGTTGGFDLIILDVKIPALDGFQLLERFRATPELGTTRIVMLTSIGGEHDVVRALDLGADDYIIKPFSPVEVVARVHRLIGRR